MKVEWKDIEFVFVQYKDTGISILSAVDDLQVRLNVWLFVLPLKKVNKFKFKFKFNNALSW